jgi:hypothetical protein
MDYMCSIGTTILKSQSSTHTGNGTVPLFYSNTELQRVLSGIYTQMVKETEYV